MSKNTTSAWFAVMVARDALRILRHCRVLGVVEELLIALQLHEKSRSIIVRGKNLAPVTNQETTAIGDLAEQRNDVDSQFDRRLVAQVVAASGCGVRLTAVIPPQCHRILL